MLRATGLEVDAAGNRARTRWMADGGMGGCGQSSDEESVAERVTENFESVTVDGVTLHDLTQPLS